MKYSLQNLIHLTLIPELGSNRVRKIADSFPDWQSLHSASIPQVCGIEGLDTITAKNLIDGIRDDRLVRKAEKQIDIADKTGADILTIWDENYPANLRRIYNPPVLLFIQGEMLGQDSQAVAMVGTRNVSDYGRVTSDRLARDLAARGITVVSGMATGIDSSSHWGTLKNGGRTIAVLGSGVDVVYPPENNSLYKKIVEHGAVVSELPFGTRPNRGTFPARNRIISGLSLGTVIIEAGSKSGALITATAALEQNREVFAVPGNITSKQCEGTNRLIKEGVAKLVQSADDIISEIEPLLKKSGPSARQQVQAVLSGDEQDVFEAIPFEPILVDNLSAKIGITAPQLATPLLTLEIKGLIRKLPGNKYVRS